MSNTETIDSSVNTGPDRRRWSITAKGLSQCLREFFKLGIQSTTVLELQKTLRAKGIYPARDFAHLCSAEPPDVFFTYHSAQNYVEVQEIVWNAFSFAWNDLQARRPGMIDEVLDPLIADGIRLWVDFIFIDQSSRDIRKELEVLPILLKEAKIHYVLGTSPLERAWCCYEIALFNQHTIGRGELNLRSFIAPTETIFFGWPSVVTTEEKDKLYIEDQIIKTFPNGFEGFHAVMNQANAVAVLPLGEGRTYYTPDAMDNMRNAVDYFYNRFYSIK